MRPGDQFNTTRWTMVLRAASDGADAGAAALEQLCRIYWPPLYAYVRRRGHSPHDAEDLTQEFFARLLAKGSLESVRQEKGRFRSFLLASMNHFLANEWDRSRTEKRGGRLSFISMDEESWDGLRVREGIADLNAERLFQRRWALAVLNQAMTRLSAEAERAGRAALFDRLKGYLEGEPAEGEYARLAQELGWRQGAVALTVHRLRARLNELVREEIAHTVPSENEVEDELRQLYAALQ